MLPIFSNPDCYKKDWLVAVSDGYGDDCSSSVGTWRNNKFEFLAKSTGSGIGRIYRYATLLLGMRPGVDEHKIMGLAPYADQYHWQNVRKILHKYLRVNGLVIDYTNKDKDIYFSLKKNLRAARFDGIAGGLQKFSEEITTKWINNSVIETGIRNVTFSGGVAMNIKINKALAEVENIENIFVGPSGGDESLSIGATFGLWHQRYGEQTKITPLKTAYLGPSYTKEDVLASIECLHKDYKIYFDPSTELISEKLVEYKILGRSVEKMEFGARALGNRSILARADNPDLVRKLNKQIKRRDFWMPFAPLVIEESAQDYIVNPKNLASPYMTIGFDATPLAKKHLRAALHPADDTMRPQVLKRVDNPNLYKLIASFKKKTGIGGLLNTSLNLHGEPICCSPEDSVSTFVRSNLDGLILDGVLVMRK